MTASELKVVRRTGDGCSADEGNPVSRPEGDASVDGQDGLRSGICIRMMETEWAGVENLLPRPAA